MMKQILACLIGLACMLCWGCSGEPDFIEVENAQWVDALTVLTESSYSTRELNFKVSGKWTAQVDPVASSWCSISSLSGKKGVNSLTITVQKNTTYDERNAAVALRCGDAHFVITVTQKQNDAIIAESNKIEIDDKGGIVPLTLRANVDYQISIADDIDWLHVVDGSSRGLSSSQIQIMVDPNEELQNRVGIITLFANHVSEQINVFQEGAEPVLVISQNEFVVPSAGETIRIELASNTEYQCELPDVDWISESPSRAVSSYTHYITVAENVDYDFREAVIVFKNLSTGATEDVVITQMQKDAIIVAKTEFRVSDEESILDFIVSTNVDFGIQVSDDWIHVNESTRALDERTLSFFIDANVSKQERKGTIRLSKGGLDQSVSIVQVGRGDEMKIKIVHGEKEFDMVAFHGEFVSGNVDWGDGMSGRIGQNHVFVDGQEKSTVFSAHGAESFILSALNSISSITIYCEEDEKGESVIINTDKQQ